MKTCATCGNRRDMDADHFLCLEHGENLPTRVFAILGCEAHEEKRTPLRLECECEWLWHECGTAKFQCPSLDDGYRSLAPFKGKRTRMTLEEIV